MKNDMGDLMEEGVTYGASGVLIDGGKWYFRSVGYDLGVICRGFMEVEVV